MDLVLCHLESAYSLITASCNIWGRGAPAVFDLFISVSINFLLVFNHRKLKHKSAIRPFHFLGSNEFKLVAVSQ